MGSLQKERFIKNENKKFNNKFLSNFYAEKVQSSCL